MATRELLSPAQRLRLTELPDPMDERDLARHHTLSEEDLASIGKRRLPETKLGFAVQLCYLRFPGRPLRSRERPPGNLLEYVAAQRSSARPPLPSTGTLAGGTPPAASTSRRS